MNDLSPTVAISPLRQRLIDDMNVRRFSRETQRNYIRDVGRFATSDASRRSCGAHLIPPPQMTCVASRSNNATPACRRRP